ncbi:MAG: RluA family pseudouridine synthase [Planctomycetes bacterium]|nr:RluA family pseudouridine synthase [Planctomycetota bacterium]
MSWQEQTVPIGEAEAGQRLDRLLRKLLRDLPLSAIFRHLRSGGIRVDGKKADGSLRLVAGMTLQLRLPAEDLAGLHAAPPPPPRSGPPGAWPRELEPRIVFRDDDVLVVDKPAGLAAQPGAGLQGRNLVDWLEHQGLGARSATFQPAPAHRLDLGTSGLIAIGLSPLGARGLAAAFRDDQVEKVYLAVVHGVPEPERGSIDAPLRVRDEAGPRDVKVVVDPAGQPARTDYEVMGRGPGVALLRLVLHTGRTHQIRAHLRHLGHPIVGDRRYGSSRDLGRRFLLHAAELTFPHPRTGQSQHCRSRQPRDFAAHLG